MKKQVLTFLAIITTSLTFAQGSKVTSASNYLRYGELDNAMNAIEAASKHSSTSGKAKTWFYRGKVYHAINDSQDEKFKNLHPNPLMEAYQSYKKAMEMPDANRLDQAELERLFAAAGNNMVNKGIQQFNNKDFENAVNSFEVGIEVANHFKAVDSLAYYYAAISSAKAKQTDKAIKYLNKCVEIDYQGAMAFFYLADIYNNNGDKEKFKETIEAGRAKYPDDANLLTQEINIYLNAGDSEGAVKALNQAIEKDPKNKTLFYARGNMYEKQAEVDSSKTVEYYKNAEADYKKAIELDNSYFEAYYNLGAMIYNQAVAQMEIINKIKDNKKYAEEKAKADEIFKSSLPYLERAHELDPTDKSTMISLKELYVRTGNTEKYNDIKSKLEN